MLSREGDQVTYRAAHRDGRAKPTATVALSVWQERAKGARTAERAIESGSCLATGWVSALCEVGAHLFAGHTHVVDEKFFCESHCPAHGGSNA